MKETKIKKVKTEKQTKKTKDQSNTLFETKNNPKQPNPEQPNSESKPTALFEIKNKPTENSLDFNDNYQKDYIFENDISLKGIPFDKLEICGDNTKNTGLKGVPFDNSNGHYRKGNICDISNDHYRKGNICDISNDPDPLWSEFLNEVNNYDEIIEQTEFKNIEYDVTEMPISPNWNEENNTQYEVVRRKNICITCNIDLVIEKTSYVCPQCGYESKNDTYSEMTSVAAYCNVNNDGFIPIKFTGRDSHRHQKCLYKTSANYSKYRKITTERDMRNLNNVSEKMHIPLHVIKEACETFDKIKQKGIVFRKDGKRGVLSACLYYACYNNGISKTPTEIAQFSEIEEKFQSQGDRILHDLNEKGIISIPTKINPIYDYINRYFEILNIDCKYKPFVIDLIKRADEKNIHLLHDNKTNTKAIGSIYILIDRTEYKNKISKEKIEKECGISKTTFIRYCDIIYNYYKLFKRVFKKHKIHMPIEWKK